MPVIVPLDYPDKPSVNDPYAADRVSLRDLLTWKHGPSNAARLLDRGATVALTSRGLSSPGSFHEAIRKAIKAGLPADEALACMTVRPARLLGIDSVAGTIAPGRLANLVGDRRRVLRRRIEDPRGVGGRPAGPGEDRGPDSRSTANST